jgi:prepilin-type processing-associated H-X9-DG protein
MKVLLQMRRKPGCSSSLSGFTLVDLAAVLTVVGLIVLLSIPALAKTRGRTHRAQCAANLKQFALAQQLYALENSERLPVKTGGGGWAWDMPWDTGTILTQWVSWRQLYCPGTSYSEADNFQLWNLSVSSDLRVTGYGLTLPGGAVHLTNQNYSLIPSGSQPPSPSGRVLIADATISSVGQDNPALRNNYNYTRIIGGFYKYHLSPHLSGMIPAGGNLAMLDGHVQWRGFEKMIPRTPGSGIVFWW